MNKKIYFAGSIRGGRNDATLYKTGQTHQIELPVNSLSK